MRVPFGPFAPDLAKIIGPGHLTVAKNVVPSASGYEPYPSLATVTGATALDARARGAISGIDAGGNAFAFAGDQTKLYRITASGAVDVSKAGTTYNCVDKNRWEFAIFDQLVIATNPNDPPQVFDLVMSTRFEDLNVDAPRARHAAVIEDFLFFGNIFDPVLGPLPNAISWSAIGNARSWPTRGTDEALAAQSDLQPLRGDGGWVQAVVPGAEIGAVFQEREISRLDYRGGDVMFEINRVEPNRGALLAGGAVGVGRFVFYLWEDGFYLFDYTSSRPIGKDSVNDFFFTDFDPLFPDRVWMARDPDSTRIFVCYPGVGHTAGTPNRILVYDWALDRFSVLEVTVELLTRAVEPGVTLDTLPDDDLDGGLGSTSFDDRVTPPGALRIGAFNGAHVFSQFSGPNLAAVLETGDLELTPGRRAMLTEVRPLVDGREATIQIATFGTRQDPLRYGLLARQDEDGKCPVRAEGRYHRLRANLPSGFTVATGLELAFAPRGRR